MDLFLIILAFLALIIASYTDLKKREVPNWLSFSLLAVSSAYLVFNSLVLKSLPYFLSNLLGLLIFIALGFGFYYARIFAGGDAKLMMSLGVCLTFSLIIRENLSNYLYFIILLLFSGGVYGLVFSFFPAFSRKKIFFSSFKNNFKKYKMIFSCFFILAILSFIVPVYLNDNLLFLLPLVFLAFPLLLIYSKSVESCMIALVSYKNLTVGDWLNQEIRLGKKTIKPHWEGLSEEQLALIQKHRKNVLIKQGLPFVPAFLIAFIIFLLSLKYGLFSIFRFF